MFDFLRFPRSKPAYESRPAEPTTTLEGVSELLQSWLNHMRDLLHRRRLAAPPDRPAIDEQIDQLCQEAAEDVARTGQDKRTTRIRRMKQLALDEMVELRDKARRENP